MCEPTTILMIGTAVAVAATAAVGVVQYQQAQKNEKQAEQVAKFEENAQRDRARRLMAAQRVGYAKAGVTLQGSPLDVIEDTAASAELDALAIRYGGASRAAAFRAQGTEALIGTVGNSSGALLTGYTAMSQYNTPANTNGPRSPGYSMPGRGY